MAAEAEATREAKAKVHIHFTLFLRLFINSCMMYSALILSLHAIAVAYVSACVSYLSVLFL